METIKKRLTNGLWLPRLQILDEMYATTAEN